MIEIKNDGKWEIKKEIEVEKEDRNIYDKMIYDEITWTIYDSDDSMILDSDERI